MPSAGIDSLPNQVTSRRTLKGLSFNLLVAGPTGIGKTTLLNSLFDLDYGDSPDLDREISKVSLRVKEFRPQNKTIDVKLTMMETKGFDNQLDKSSSHKHIVDYINARFKDHCESEYCVREDLEEEECYTDINDARVHCCIYMISPISNGLKAIDLVTMSQLHQRVCLIPAIGKCDILTRQERIVLKEKMKNEILLNGIEIYSPKDHQLPLAVAASNDVVAENGKRQRVRCYPWGQMSIDRDSEFSLLRDLVLRSNMLSLIETTTRNHYEKFRRDLRSSYDKPEPKRQFISSGHSFRK